MPEFDYDLFVIGAGSGGVRAARLASGVYGAKAAVAEEYRVGGTCVIRGCVPKKYLVFAANYGRAFGHAESYGWTHADVRLDWETLRDNVNAEVDRLSGVYWRNLENSGVEVIAERAEITAPHTIKLVGSDRTVTARIILIATGARPWRPLDLEGQEHAITSNEVFHLPKLPRHVLIAGGGYIACEFAGVFAGLGVKTCQLYRGDTVLRGFDMDVRTAVHAELGRAGVRIITHAVFEKIEKCDDATLVCKLTNGETIETDLVMFGLGRDPNTQGLGLEKVGVEVDQNGAVKVDEYSKSIADHVYAVGDVTDRLQLTPVAIREGAAFAHTVFGGEPTAFDHRNVGSAVFTPVPVGSVGLSEADARKAHGPVDVYKTDFRPLRHVFTGDAQRVMMKLVVRRSDQVVVGCHIVGEDAPEMIQLAAIAVKAGLTKKAWDDTCAVHPTIAEELVTLREVYEPPELKAAE